MSKFNESKPKSNVKFWKNTNPNVEGYQESIGGVVVEVGEKQVYNPATKSYAIWQDSGLPQIEWYMVIKNRKTNEELIWAFKPRKSLAAQACFKALTDAGYKADLEEMLGLIVRVSTKDGVYNNNHPRPFWVEILGHDPSTPTRGIVEFDQWLKNMGMVSAADGATPATEPEPEQQYDEPVPGYLRNESPALQVYANEDIPF